MPPSAAPTPGPAGDWTVPGAFDVAPGVYRIPLPLPQDGLRAVNVYALLDDEGAVLIDGGWALPLARQRLEEALRLVDRSVHDIRSFLVTHLHRDHYTQAAALGRELGREVSLGAGERPSLRRLQSSARPRLDAQLELLRAAGAGALAERLASHLEALPPHDPGHWADPDHWLGETVLEIGEKRSLTVVETPGHTRGHVVFHDAAGGLLFAGDHVLPSITPSIAFEQAPPPDPLGAYLGSLAKVRAMPDALLLPAHGPVAASVHARVDELVAHHGRRLEATEAAIAAGASSAAEAAARLAWTRREQRLWELDELNQMLAILETRAHLVLLAAQRRVTAAEDPAGVERYSLGAAP